MGDNVSTGASVSYTDMNFSNSYHNSNSSYGFGAYVDIHEADESQQWFIRPSVSYSKYDTTVNRASEPNTEAVSGKAKIKGTSETLEVGQRFNFNDKQAIWSSGLHHSKTSRSSYSESNALLPINYDEVDFDDTEAFVRSSITAPITKSVNFVVTAELDRRLNFDSPDFKAEGSYIGSVDEEAHIHKTRGFASAGVVYSPSKKISVSFTPSISQSALGDNMWGTNFNLNYSF